MQKPLTCLKCNSTNFVKHGITPKGVQRYRCTVCNKTWTSSKSSQYKIDLAKISQFYLQGQTTRDLVKYYKTSPVRINQQVRSYLKHCPDWHSYIDSFIDNHSPKQIYLSGKKFHCSWNGAESNEMYVAFSMDSMTGFVIAYRVSCGESNEIWHELLNDLQKRHIKTNSFLTNGSEKSLSAVQKIFPKADIKITYHKNFRDKELGCCLSRISAGNKLIPDASKVYFSLENKSLAYSLGISEERMLQDFLNKNIYRFTEIIKTRLTNRSKMYNDSLPNLFQKRFEKFHLLKEDPFPIINSWVAYQMLTPDNFGISKLSLYTQEPYNINFKHFVNNKIKTADLEHLERPFLEQMLLEVVVRGLELPVNSNECGFNVDKCLLLLNFNNEINA
jgi:transposase-like protein